MWSLLAIGACVESGLAATEHAFLDQLFPGVVFTWGVHGFGSALQDPSLMLVDGRDFAVGS